MGDRVRTGRVGGGAHHACAPFGSAVILGVRALRWRAPLAPRTHRLAKAEARSNLLVPLPVWLCVSNLMSTMILTNSSYVMLEPSPSRSICRNGERGGGEVPGREKNREGRPNRQGGKAQSRCPLSIVHRNPTNPPIRQLPNPPTRQILQPLDPPRTSSMMPFASSSVTSSPCNRSKQPNSL